MFHRCASLGLSLLLACATCVARAAEPDAVDKDAASAATPTPEKPAPQEEPAPFVPSGNIEAGAGFQTLTGGYANWNSQFVRGVYAADARNTWNAEVADMQEFGDRGLLLVLGNSHVINDDWYVSTSLSTSAGGFFLPRLRGDVVVNRKFLEPRNLVLGAGLSSVQAKDDHRDLALLLNAAYYFESPWVVEGGVRVNRSNPGSVVASYYAVAATYGREKNRYISLRYAQGQEGYQLVSNGGNTLANFPSHDALLTWREWVGLDWGVQARIGEYGNPYYRRMGGEFSLFRDF